MLLPMPLSQFVNIEIQYRSLSVKRMQQDATGLGLSIAELLPAMERGISRDGCVSTRALGVSKSGYADSQAGYSTSGRPPRRPGAVTQYI